MEQAHTAITNMVMELDLATPVVLYNRVTCADQMIEKQVLTPLQVQAHITTRTVIQCQKLPLLEPKKNPSIHICSPKSKILIRE